MTSRPVTRVVPKSATSALSAVFTARGLRPARQAKNPYIAFEVRTDGRSIFTLYTSGKLVSTVRADDATGLLLEDEIATLLDGDGSGGARHVSPRGHAGTDAGTDSGLGAPSDGETSPDAGASASTRGRRSAASPPGRTRSAGPAPGRTLLAGCDETGTGELLGTTFLGGALLRPAVIDAVETLAGHVETKSARTRGGWESLGEGLAAMRADGLVIETLCVRNPLFDAYRKNDLLDLAYVRLVGDLLAAAGLRDAPLGDVDLVIDDYGARALLGRAAAAWRARGASVRIETKADVTSLAARAASVFARSARAREMSGLMAEELDGPLGTGNAGNPVTLRWLRRRARSGAPWPAFVKASFRTVRDLDGLEPVTKRDVPAPEDMLDAASAEGFVAGRLDVSRARVRLGDGFVQRLDVDARGRLRDTHDAHTGRDARGACPALDFLALLFGGLVLDDDLPLDVLDRILVREDGLASGQRILMGPVPDPDCPRWIALAHAHRFGIVQLVPTDEIDADARAMARSALRVTRREDCGTVHLRM